MLYLVLCLAVTAAALPAIPPAPALDYYPVIVFEPELRINEIPELQQMIEVANELAPPKNPSAIEKPSAPEESSAPEKPSAPEEPPAPEEPLASEGPPAMEEPANEEISPQEEPLAAEELAPENEPVIVQLEVEKAPFWSSAFPWLTSFRLPATPSISLPNWTNINLPLQWPPSLPSWPASWPSLPSLPLSWPSLPSLPSLPSWSTIPSNPQTRYVAWRPATYAMVRDRNYE